MKSKAADSNRVCRFICFYMEYVFLSGFIYLLCMFC